MSARSLASWITAPPRLCVYAMAIALVALIAFFAPARAQAPASSAASAPPANAPSNPAQRPRIVQRTFATPEEAGSALMEALDSANNRAIFAVLGRGSGPLFRSGDPVQDTATRSAIAADYRVRVKYEMEGSAKATMLLGDKDYPFPYPLVKSAAGWQFDAKGGAEEIVNRRIGANELAAINVCLAYVDAQREYVLRDRNDNGLLEYAQRLESTPGTQDGLYWETKQGESPSPLGPLAARARAEGYVKGASAPYHGYLYKILTAQGNNAAGGAYDYIVDGKMIGGFALVAYPARWGASGVMTFVCNHEGIVYEKNLGRESLTIAASMTTYDPDATWKRAPQQ
ncbi:MAG TPA: DUF2950 domain-containing protein [Casimicrobiaceae bacterium]|nr:DUF2950 domain-containing protein [Casimicrobiaceae bacterium]